jgi:hypothetical protein
MERSGNFTLSLSNFLQGSLFLLPNLITKVPTKVFSDVSKYFTLWADGTTSIQIVGRIICVVINLIIISCAEVNICALRAKNVFFNLFSLHLEHRAPLSGVPLCGVSVAIVF